MSQSIERSNPLGPKTNSFDSFDTSMKAISKSEMTLENMIEGNLAEATEQPILSMEADDASAMMQEKRLLQVRKKNHDSNRVKEIFEARTRILSRKESADGFADQFSSREGNKNYHLDVQTLSQLAYEDLGETIDSNSSPEAIIEVIRTRLQSNDQSQDPAVINKCLEFLVEVTQAQLSNDDITTEQKTTIDALIVNLEQAQKIYRETQKVAIDVAEKIIDAVDAVMSTTGLNFKDTLARYREIVHSPPTIQTMRKEYEKNGGYKVMKREFEGLNRFLTSNFKRENIENAELSQLVQAAKKMQAIIHVFSSSKDQCSSFLKGYIINNRLHELEDEKKFDFTKIKQNINYESVAKLFFDLAEPRFMTPEIMKEKSAILVNSTHQEPFGNAHLKIAILTMIRNMNSEVSPKQLYYSEVHKTSLYDATIKSLEDLENKLDDVINHMLQEDE